MARLDQVSHPPASSSEALRALAAGVRVERVVAKITLTLLVTGCVPLANRLPAYVHYYEPQASGAQIHSYSCKNSGPPEDAKFTIDTNTFDVEASRPDWSLPNATIKLTWVLRPGEDLQFDPQRIAVVDAITGRSLEVTSRKFVRRNLNFTQITEEMDRPMHIQGRTGRGWAERVWLVVSVFAGETKRFTVTFPTLTISGQAVAIPAVTFEDKSGIFIIVPFC